MRKLKKIRADQLKNNNFFASKLSLAIGMATSNRKHENDNPMITHARYTASTEKSSGENNRVKAGAASKNRNCAAALPLTSFNAARLKIFDLER